MSSLKVLVKEGATQTTFLSCGGPLATTCVVANGLSQQEVEIGVVRRLILKLLKDIMRVRLIKPTKVTTS